MFQFPPFALTKVSDMSSTCRVAPFGYLRIKTCLQFPGAFRSLPRPSSPPEAQASTVRSCNLLAVRFSLNESQELRVYTCSHLLVALKLQSTTLRFDSLSLSLKLQTFISSSNFTSLSFLKLVNELLVFLKRVAKVRLFSLPANFSACFFINFSNFFRHQNPNH